MSTRKIVNQKIKEYQIQEFVKESLNQVGLSNTKLQMTPLGEKIIIAASRPGLIVGRKGQSIKKLTQTLKKKFGLENPQIEINEVEAPNLDANIVAERISNSLERFGSQRFKGVGHKCMEDVMNAGALGIEILISGKVPSSRAKRWRFYQGYLKKSGDIAIEGVRKAYANAQLKTGTVGIQVRIMPPDLTLPDTITFKKEITKGVVEEIKEGSEEKTEKKEEKETKKKTTTKLSKGKQEAVKTSVKKTTKKKEEEKVVEKVKEETPTEETAVVENSETKTEEKPAEASEEEQ